MPVESADDLAGFFDPAEFGKELTLYSSGGPVLFLGIVTEGAKAEDVGLGTTVTTTVPRIICRRADVPNIQQNEEIQLPDGRLVLVNDLQFKSDLLIIHYHEGY